MATATQTQKDERQKKGGGFLVLGALIGLGAWALTRGGAEAAGSDGRGPWCGGSDQPLLAIGPPCPAGSPGTLWAVTPNPDMEDVRPCHIYDGFTISQAQGSVYRVFWRVKNVGPNTGEIEVGQVARAVGLTIRVSDQDSKRIVEPGEVVIIEGDFTPQSFIWFKDAVSVGFELNGTNCDGEFELDLARVSGQLDFASEHPELFPQAVGPAAYQARRR